MTLAIFSALLCVLTRAILNVCDRYIFKDEASDFWKNLAMNALLPLTVSILVMLLFVKEFGCVWAFMFEPGIILSGLGAQLTASVISSSYRKLNVKTVVLASKISDIFIPLVVFAITNTFKVQEYLFACLSTIIFVPLIIPFFKTESRASLMNIFKIIFALSFQAAVSSYFCISAFSGTWPKFVSMMTGIIFWRTCLLAIVFISAKPLISKRKVDNENGRKTRYGILASRSILAFVSQSLFFYSISDASASLAWPILNATPFVSCFSAHFVLGERINMADILVAVLFSSISILYFITQGVVS